MYSPSTLLSLVLLASSSLVSALPQGEPGYSQLDARGLDIATTGAKAAAADCPATNNGANRNYAAKVYTANQVSAAMLAAAKLAVRSKQIGASKSFPAINR
jgi:hypothetical protein